MKTSATSNDQLPVQNRERDQGLAKYDVTIQNTRTSALPTTGSVGTVLFAVLGIALMAGAVWLYARSKRQSAK